jgi:hypothetical protein
MAHVSASANWARISDTIILMIFIERIILKVLLMQPQRRQIDETTQQNDKARLPYERPEILYSGKISIRAGSPFGGRIGPPGGPDVVPGS